ncbi:MAG: methyl-accepting chemotaxis protein [Ruminococcus sp.]|nr:methyl-accepting chemotaxis protein [Ruminococcus sp.]
MKNFHRELTGGLPARINRRVARLMVNMDTYKMSEKLREAAKLIKNDALTLDDAIEEFGRLEEVSTAAFKVLRQTEKQIHAIQNVSMNTKILGFNASIEANRAKEFGKGFGVIATEVRALAESSNESVSKVAEVVAKLSDFSDGLKTEMTEVSRQLSELRDDLTRANRILKELRQEIDEDMESA